MSVLLGISKHEHDKPKSWGRSREELKYSNISNFSNVMDVHNLMYTRKIFGLTEQDLQGTVNLDLHLQTNFSTLLPPHYNNWMSDNSKGVSRL